MAEQAVGGISAVSTSFFGTPSCWTLSPCSQVIFWESSRARVAQLAGTLLTSTLLLCGRVRNNNNNTIWRGPESRSLPSRWPNPIPAIPPYVVKTPHLHGPRSKHLFFKNSKTKARSGTNLGEKKKTEKHILSRKKNNRKH